MSDVQWAAVIVAPAAFVLYVPFATYLFVVRTGRQPRSEFVRSLVADEQGRIHRTRGDTAMAVFFVALTQLAAASLVVSGMGHTVGAGLAMIAGVAEWIGAILWLVGLRLASPTTGDASPFDK